MCRSAALQRHHREADKQQVGLRTLQNHVRTDIAAKQRAELQTQLTARSTQKCAVEPCSDLQMSLCAVAQAPPACLWGLAVLQAPGSSPSPISQVSWHDCLQSGGC